MSTSKTCFLLLLSTLLASMPNSSCLEHPKTRIKRVVGGEKVQKGDFSFVVSLKQKSFIGRKYRHFCTGSLVGRYWVLTAGHCFSNRKWVALDHLVADIGSRHLSGGTRHKIARYAIHPNQSESVEIYRNDLCLVRLEKPVNDSSPASLVSLGTIQDQNELPVVSAGWGRTRAEDFELPEELRSVKLKTLKYNECQRRHSKKNNLVDEVTHICAAAGNGSSLCFGDSGGPLVDPNTGHLVAVFSSLEDCTGDYPVLFMKIAYFINWINDITGLGLTL